MVRTKFSLIIHGYIVYNVLLNVTWFELYMYGYNEVYNVSFPVNVRTVSSLSTYHSSEISFFSLYVNSGYS